MASIGGFGGTSVASLASPSNKRSHSRRQTDGTPGLFREFFLGHEVKPRLLTDGITPSSDVNIGEFRFQELNKQNTDAGNRHRRRLAHDVQFIQLSLREHVIRHVHITRARECHEGTCMNP